MLCCPRCSHLSTILNNVVEPESGVTILFNIVDNYEQCGQQTEHCSIMFSSILQQPDRFMPCRNRSKIGKCKWAFTFDIVIQRLPSFSSRKRTSSFTKPECPSPRLVRQSTVGVISSRTMHSPSYKKYSNTYFVRIFHFYIPLILYIVGSLRQFSIAVALPARAERTSLNFLCSCLTCAFFVRLNARGHAMKVELHSTFLACPGD